MKSPRWNLHLLSLLLLAALFGTAQAAVTTPVAVNKSVLVNLKAPAERVSVTNPSIADAVVISPKIVQINGISAGTTSVIVWEKGADKPMFFDVRVAGDASQLEAQLKNANLEGVTAEFARDTLILSGSVPSDAAAARALQIAQAYAAKVVDQMTRVEDGRQVLLQVKVVQIDKTALRKLGISGLMKGKSGEGFYNLIGVPSGTSQNSTSTSTTTTSTKGEGITGNIPGLGGITPLDPYTFGISHFSSGVGAVIQALATKNLAKILAEPNLLVKSGDKGNFLAGSKIPYSVVLLTGGISTSSIVFVDVGIKLTFAPQVSEDGRILLKIDPAEVSSITGTLAVNGYPIIDIREVKTSVELREGESLVLAGLLQEEQIRTMSKVPLLGDIPILGALFRSTESDLKEKELAFFITPKLVKPLGKDEPRPELVKKPTAAEEKELRWIPGLP